MATLVVLKNTVVKTRPLQSSQLENKDKFSAGVGTSLEIISYELERNNHYRIVLAKPREGKPYWYVFREHCEIREGAKTLESPMLGVRTDRPLLVPYKLQTDNVFNPTGACNVTSLAMVLEYYKVARKPAYSDIDQLEDELYQYSIDYGYNRQSPDGLRAIAEDYGVIDRFNDKAGISDAKKALSEGKPCICHGYFTAYGHIIVLVGFNSIGFICHDPFGRLDAYDNYDKSVSGQFVTYAYHQFSRLAMPDSYLWLHVLE